MAYLVVLFPVAMMAAIVVAGFLAVLFRTATWSVRVLAISLGLILSSLLIASGFALGAGDGSSRGQFPTFLLMCLVGSLPALLLSWSLRR